MNNSANVLKTESLHAFYNSRQILKEINLSLKPGEFVCLSGPNGSGKSTLMSLLAGTNSEQLKFKGTVFIDKKNILEFKKKELAKKLTYMPQTENSPWNYLVKDIILFGRFPHTSFTGVYHPTDYDIVAQTAETLGISHLLNRQVFSLSGGEFQRVRIARALAQEAKILLLDEPAANLDFVIRFELLKLVKKLAKEKKLSVLVSIHDINLAAVFADKLMLLSAFSEEKNIGEQLFQGSPHEILTPEILFNVYNRNFGTFIHPEYKCINIFAK
ncbi:MAG: ABC transporter ATP-binding protein [Spirochaetaceae bacterium]|nr:ABC transporter ATP-binding protein [Spirochaetaceae bacterium]